jgi:hypothetical protein
MIYSRDILQARLLFGQLERKRQGMHKECWWGNLLEDVSLKTGTMEGKVKAIPVQAMEALRSVRGRDSHIFRHSVHTWLQSCQPYAPATFTPHETSWYSFLFEAESTTGP